MIKYSTKNKHVFYAEVGVNLQDYITDKAGWWYWVEVGLLGSGPFSTEQEAIDALREYVNSL